MFEGALQTAWDRLLARRPVLLLLGSDVHMMERLTAYDRPLYGRADDLVLRALDVAETGAATGLQASEAIDAHLISGGLPGILRSWPYGTPAWAFVEQEWADPATPLFGIPEASLLAEFAAPDQARRVLEAVGSGERTHGGIAAAAGSRRGAVPSGSLSPLLRRLVDKHVLAVDEPLSTRPGKPALHRVDDSNLRLYLAVLRDAQELARRGRAEAAVQLVQRRWTSWRGKAVEPLVRESLALAATDDRSRSRTSGPSAGGGTRIGFVGSVKWLASPFDRHDLASLSRAAAQLPGHDGTVGTVVVSLSGVEPGLGRDAVDMLWGADDVVAAWG